jgi:hypothetical protein
MEAGWLYAQLQIRIRGSKIARLPLVLVAMLADRPQATYLHCRPENQLETYAGIERKTNAWGD